MSKPANVNGLWAALLVEELVRQGLVWFVIAPGSRSAPLVVAATQNPRARCRLCVDERAAGFYAVGIARASGVPAAVITTSGTAAANLWPAVVEAAMDHVPLLLLTADRPAELRDCGANQTIAQPGLFGSYARWSFDLPPPDDGTPATMVLTVAAQAYARASGDPGPVHLNCAFREPLVPEPTAQGGVGWRELATWQQSQAPFVRTLSASVKLDATQLQPIIAALDHAPGMIVAGTLRPDEGLAAQQLAATLGWPLWADIRSGLRLGNAAPLHLPHLDRLLEAGEFAPQTVLQLGARLTSKRLHDALTRQPPNCLILAASAPERHDPSHRALLRVPAPPGELCRVLLDHLAPRAAPAWTPALIARNQQLSDAVARTLAEQPALTEPWIARTLTEWIPARHSLVLSSSLPIRWVQGFATKTGAAVRVAANRGASGIDGVLATAAGFAAGCSQPATLLIGDLALLHDLGSLALLREQAAPLVVVVLHNGGGGIFRQLPIAAYPELLSPWFDAAHDVHFAGVAGDFGLHYEQITTKAEWERAYPAAVQRNQPALLEVICAPAATDACVKILEARLAPRTAQ